MTNAGGLRAPVRAVTFDLDGTLWALSGVIHRAEEAAHEFLRARFPDVSDRYDVDDLRALRQRLVETEPGWRHDLGWLRKQVLRQAGAEVGYSGEALDALVEGAFNVFLDARHEVVLYDDSLTTLEALGERFTLGVVTNGNADVRRLGLDRYFDFTLSAEEVGAAKPARLVFQTVCHRADALPPAVVHVGDEVESDVLGAARYGMQAVWINRDDESWPEGVDTVPHVRVASLQELRELLEAAG